MTNRASRPEAWFEKADHDLLAVEQLMAASAVVWDVWMSRYPDAPGEPDEADIRAGVETRMR